MPATPDPEVIYARRPVSRRAWAIPFVVLAVFTLFMVAKDLPHVRTVTVVASLGASSPVVLIWLLTLWSMNRYGAVTVTRETLRVGRDRIPVADIEPQWVRLLAQRADPTLAQRLATSATTLQGPGTPRVDAGRGRLLGGAYGATLGDDLVTLELRHDGSVGDTRVSVPTKDRRGLLAGLLAALEARGSV